MRFSLVIHVTGIIVRLFGTMFVAPLVVCLFYGEHADALGFAILGAVTAATGHLMRQAGGSAADEAVERMRRIEGLAIVSGAWLLIAWFASVPYLWNGLGPVDAMFEAMSGLTTTGATIFEDFSAYGRGIFFWRGFTQWIGGMGVIALFVAILPRLAIGGRELFFAEMSGHDDEKVAPQIRRTAALLWRLYAALTLLQIAALVIVGMPLYDAICNSFATVAAAGFSPHPQSIGGYQNPAAEWVIIVFMFLAGANFALQFRALAKRDFSILAKDEELRAYAGVILLASAVIAIVIWDHRDAAGTIRASLFHVLSIITTTGFATQDFAQWNDQALAVLLGLMFIGACAGSASGGPKVVRHVLLAKYTLQELRRTLHPRAVLPVKLGGRVVPPPIMQGVIVFFLFYMLTFAITAAVVVLLGTDLVTGISAAAAAISNVGPAFGTLGPYSHFGDLHPASKVVLTLAMWIGRLEVITVLVILRPEAWRTGQWRIRPARMAT
jgi:trk system potassium uptake protein TrkH